MPTAKCCPPQPTRLEWSAVYRQMQTQGASRQGRVGGLWSPPLGLLSEAHLPLHHQCRKLLSPSQARLRYQKDHQAFQLRPWAGWTPSRASPNDTPQPPQPPPGDT